MQIIRQIIELKNYKLASLKLCHNNNATLIKLLNSDNQKIVIKKKKPPLT